MGRAAQLGIESEGSRGGGGELIVEAAAVEGPGTEKLMTGHLSKITLDGFQGEFRVKALLEKLGSGEPVADGIAQDGCLPGGEALDKALDRIGMGFTRAHS